MTLLLLQLHDYAALHDNGSSSEVPTPYFALGLFSSVTHDTANEAAHFDRFFESFLSRMSAGLQHGFGLVDLSLGGTGTLWTALSAKRLRSW